MLDPARQRHDMPLWEWNTGGPTIGTHFWISAGASPNPGGPGCLYANLVDTGGNSHIFASPLNLIVSNLFQHVALTYNNASGVATLYYNGASVASQNLGSFTPQTSYPVYIGRRPYYTTTEYFSGLMDEVSLYAALSPPRKFLASIMPAPTGNVLLCRPL